MDLLTIDGIDLRGQAFGVSTRTGRYSLPNKRGENLIIPGSSGEVWLPNKPFEAGVGVLMLWAVGGTTVGGKLTVNPSFTQKRIDLENNIATLMRLFTRSHRLSTIRGGQPDGTIRRAQVEWTEWTDPEVMAGGTRAEWSIGYTIPKTWWEDENTLTQAATAGATLPKTLNLTSFANMTGTIEDASFTVPGPITNPRITDSETGSWVQYTGTVPNGSFWYLDVAAATSKVGTTVGGASSVMANTTHAGGFKMLVIPNTYNLANTPQLVLSGSAGGTATNLSVTARRKWVNG
jgi:hypothetical protein